MPGVLADAAGDCRGRRLCEFKGAVEEKGGMRPTMPPPVPRLAHEDLLAFLAAEATFSSPTCHAKRPMMAPAARPLQGCGDAAVTPHPGIGQGKDVFFRAAGGQ